MPALRLRLYRHFSTLPDSRALLSLLRMHAVEFETRYERGEDYGRGGHEPDRLEVWIYSDDYEQVKQWENALTPEQALALAENYLLISFSDDELREIVAQAAEYPTEAAAAKHILLERKPYPSTEILAPTPPAQSPSTLSNALGKLPSKWLIGLLVLAAAYFAVYLLLT